MSQQQPNVLVVVVKTIFSNSLLRSRFKCNVEEVEKWIVILDHSLFLILRLRLDYLIWNLFKNSALRVLGSWVGRWVVLKIPEPGFFYREIFTVLYFALLLLLSCHSEGMRGMLVQFQTTSSKRYHYDGEGSVSFMTLSDLCLFLVQIIEGSCEKTDQWVRVHKAQNFSTCLRRERTKCSC